MSKIRNVDYDRHFANLVKINESLNLGAWDNYRKNNIIYVDVQEIVGITGACENIDTLFKVQNRLSLPLFITQTGQLSLEQSLQSFHGVFTVIHSARDEEKEDARHLRQFRLTEEEFDCSGLNMTRKNYDEEKMYDALLMHIQSTIQAMIKNVLKNNERILAKEYQRDVEKLIMASDVNFLRISYQEAIKLLNRKGYPSLKFGDDLKAEHEAKIVAILNKNKNELPVFIMCYPKEIKFFNMKVSKKDPRVCLSADLIMPHSGEAVGAAVREHVFEKLNRRLHSSNMYRLHLARGGTDKDFAWYLDIIKNKKTLPHAGYGVGNERVLQYVFGERDIRNVSLFSLLDQQSRYWDTEKYGEAGIMDPPKRHILLSIGRTENKKYLLPHIKNLVKHDNVVLYATEKTHQFLEENGVMVLRVHRISEVGKTPNIADLLRERVFDLIINIPTRVFPKETLEFTDGKLIRKAAIEVGISILTDTEVAAFVIDNLAKKDHEK